MLAALLISLAACAADDETSNGIPANYPTIAPAVVQGRYEITDVVDRDGVLALDGPVAPVVKLDVVTGELQVEPTCNLFLGSFTIDPDGSASFTVTGGSNDPDCPDDDIEQRILVALQTVDGWSEVDAGLELSGPGPTQIRLRRS